MQDAMATCSGTMPPDGRSHQSPEHGLFHRKAHVRGLLLRIWYIVCVPALCVHHASGGGGSAAGEYPWQAIARIESGAIAESSGLVRSRTHEGIFWTHNDSGAQPVLYAIRANGALVAEILVEDAPADADDWEDIAIDGEGRLYIADIGDNYLRFPTRRIIVVAEPDPFAQRSQTVRPIQILKYAYPSKRLDAEAMFVHKGDIYIIPKVLLPVAPLFRLEPADNETVPYHAVPVGTLPVSLATGADVSEDGTRLAVLSYGRLWVFDLPDNLTELAQASPRTVRWPRQFQTEGCAFDGHNLILTDETRNIYRITAEDVEAERVFTRKRRQPAP